MSGELFPSELFDYIGVHTGIASTTSLHIVDAVLGSLLLSRYLLVVLVVSPRGRLWMQLVAAIVVVAAAVADTRG